ncbi:MAG: hypothetical protein P1U42_10280 [Phycisphaerales bacterium]|nr:hypothetical protein [Phycisphaerales bacterium]
MSTILSNAQSIKPASDRLDAIVSYPLVIAIVVDNEKQLRSGVESKLDDGRVLNSTPFWVGLSPTHARPRWTAASGIWTANSFESISKIPTDKRPLGAWFIKVPLPIDAVGQGLWIQGERYELNWLPDPERTMLEAHTQNTNESLSVFWEHHLDSNAASDPAIIEAISDYYQDPFQSWRARLITDGLNPDRTKARDIASGHHQNLDALDLELSMETPGADLLRDLSRQNEARWQIILGRIWLIDPVVAHRLKNQLMQTAQFDNRVLPLWPSDTTELARLAHDLLSPFVDDQTRVLRARAWLDVQPRALAWVTDDEGQIEADSKRFLATITAISLPQTDGNSLFRLDTPSLANASSPELATLPSKIATPILVPIDPIEISPTNPVLETQPVRIRVARWTTEREVVASITPARAPYVRIGPLLNDWNMDALLNNRPQSGAIRSLNRSAAGIFRKTSKPTRSNQATGWELYFELASSNPQSTNETLNLWIGPFTNPLAVWKITPDGKVDFLQGSRPNIGLPIVRTQTQNDRWIASITLPHGVFDQDMQLQLGIDRIDSESVHTSWPRRMIPGQREPGRFTIDAKNFDELFLN